MNNITMQILAKCVRNKQINLLNLMLIEVRINIIGIAKLDSRKNHQAHNNIDLEKLDYFFKRKDIFSHIWKAQKFYFYLGVEKQALINILCIIFLIHGCDGFFPFTSETKWNLKSETKWNLKMISEFGKWIIVYFKKKNDNILTVS